MPPSPIAQPSDSKIGTPSVDRAEIAKFTAMAESWWDPNGPFRPLHILNPIRLRYIREKAQRFSKDDHAAQQEPLLGVRILDIGCGGGLLAEPLARLGADVTGIDASERNIAIARAHAEKTGAKVTYIACAAEELVGKEAAFDIVLAMEIVEHVADLHIFIKEAAKLVRPGGLLIVATLNRTAKSYLLAIIGAEYILRWLPRGTHDWRKFIKPSELAAAIRPAGLVLAELTGVTYAPLSGQWALSNDLDVNYIMVAERESSL